MFRFWFLLLLVGYGVPAAAWGGPPWQRQAQNPEYLHRSLKMITDLMVHDIYAPPVASRTYSYVSVAAYEAAVAGQPGYQSLAQQLRSLPAIPQPAQPGALCTPLSAVHALLRVGKTMIISEEKLAAFHQQLLKEFKALGIPDTVYQRSLAWGDTVAAHVLAWSAKDQFRETRSFPKYSVADDEHSWKPTPPAYLRAVEPNWNQVRPFVLDSAQQFKPAAALPFSTAAESAFFKEAHAVFAAGKNLTPEQKSIALFWDCNPFKMNVRGHVMFATKKISPGGHWINITALACKKAKAGFAASAEAYALVAVAIADGFISCWDEKYRSNVIRPETFINQYIDAAWMPLLQTPPFPEYPSGHSVISSAASVVLTALFGNRFSYADDTEVAFGLPVRHFSSFAAAAEEAAISRFYGGIHYMPAVVNGASEGRAVGQLVLQRLKTKKAAVAHAN